MEGSKSIFNLNINKYNNIKKSRIRVTLNLSTDADSSTETKTDKKRQKGPFFKVLVYPLVEINYYMSTVTSQLLHVN